MLTEIPEEARGDSEQALNCVTLFPSAMQRTVKRNNEWPSIREEIDLVVKQFNESARKSYVDAPVTCVRYDRTARSVPQYRIDMLKCELTRRLTNAGWTISKLNIDYCSPGGFHYELVAGWPSIFARQIADEKERAMSL
ncbi:hypothetical protein DFJ77DRAFT_509496 [Powellomyces hirtus]|nr:hypothetical protein DFJ77DRAFT_509496 [Powellomyces hirtus]